MRRSAAIGVFHALRRREVLNGQRSSSAPCIAHKLATTIYKETQHFPRDEWYGLRAQLRRAAVSVATNIVEGNARHSTFEYVNFLNIARGSAAEAAYLVLLGSELGHFSVAVADSLRSGYDELVPQLEALVQKMRTLAEQDQDRR